MFLVNSINVRTNPFYMACKRSSKSDAVDSIDFTNMLHSLLLVFTYKYLEDVSTFISICVYLFEMDLHVEFLGTFVCYSKVYIYNIHFICDMCYLEQLSFKL